MDNKYWKEPWEGIIKFRPTKDILRAAKAYSHLDFESILEIEGEFDDYDMQNFVMNFDHFLEKSRR